MKDQTKAIVEQVLTANLGDKVPPYEIGNAIAAMDKVKFEKGSGYDTNLTKEAIKNIYNYLDNIVVESGYLTRGIYRNFVLIACNSLEKKLLGSIKIN